jgi:hypothetical protein
MMIEQQVKIRLTWPVICRLACRACVLGLTFNEVCEKAMRDYLKPEVIEA